MVPKKPKWMPRELASKLDKKFEEFGIKISKEDLGFEAGLEMLYGGCQKFESLITELIELPVDENQWEKFSDLVADIGVEVDAAKSLSAKLEGPLDRLLGQITSVNDPKRHLKDVRSEQEGRRENGEGK